MSTLQDAPFTLAFVGYADAATSDRAAAYEDEVLELLNSHGAHLLYRGRRGPGQNAALPFEVQLIWFPDRGALARYTADERRVALIEKYGEVFTLKHAVTMDTISVDRIRWSDDASAP
jgi:uncharacterized protein (DUF1330 family)